jgi:Glycosyl hydrolases family 43
VGVVCSGVPKLGGEMRDALPMKSGEMRRPTGDRLLGKEAVMSPSHRRTFLSRAITLAGALGAKSIGAWTLGAAGRTALPRPTQARVGVGVLAMALSLACLGLATSSAHAAVITNDTFWKDTSGNPLLSQGGGVFKFGSKYYWYGVKYNGAVTYFNHPAAGKNGDTSFNAVTCYSSTDLVNWKFENNILTTSTPGIGSVSWFGRLGVVYNANTEKYVLLSQYYGSLSAGGVFFATSSTPTGNFEVEYVQYPVPGVANNTTGDQTVFTDTDGKSYVIASSASGRSNWYVIPIRSSDSLALETAVRIGGGAGREGNAMFKYNGRYYFCSSDLHGWNASHTYVISATNIFGPYSSESVMAGTDADFSHVSQTGFFITVPGSTATTVIFAGDRWADFAGNGLGYNQWCPLTFSGSTPTFKSVGKWDLNASTGTWTVAASNNYIRNPSYEADRVSQALLAGWTNWDNVSATPNSNKLGGRTGRWSAQHWSTSAYQASTSQVVSGLPNGSYTLRAWVKSSGGQATAQVFVKDFGGTEKDVSINSAIGSWTQITIPNIGVSNGQANVGVFSVASANNWVFVDDWELTKN